MGATRRYWIGIAAGVTALALAAVGLVGMVNAVFPDDEGTSVEVSALVRELQGVDRVSDPMCRDGDLMTGRNCFLQVHAAAGLSDAGQDQLATAIGEALASGASSSLRLMAELNIDSRIIGLSSAPELNAPRMQIARELDAVAPGDRVAVLWRVENDNLVTDLDNESLSVTVWSSDAGDPVALWDSFAPLAAALIPHATVTATVRTTEVPLPPNTYEWGVDGPARASWRSVTAPAGGLADTSRALAAELFGSATVRAFEVSPGELLVVATDETSKRALQETWAQSQLLEQRQLRVVALNADGSLY